MSVWQKCEDPCHKRPHCTGKFHYELSSQGPFALRESKAVCDSCGQEYELSLINIAPGRVRMRSRKSTTRYYVAAVGGLKNPEWDVLMEVLTELGHSTEREQIRERQPNGSVHLVGAPIGLVDTRKEAEEIQQRLRERLGYLSWCIEEFK